MPKHCLCMYVAQWSWQTAAKDLKQVVCSRNGSVYSKFALYSSNKLSFWHSTIALYYPAVHLVLGMQFYIFFAC